MPMPGRNISATAVIVVDAGVEAVQHAFGRPEAEQRQRYRKQLLLRGLHRSEFGERLADRFAATGTFRSPPGGIMRVITK